MVPGGKPSDISRDVPSYVPRNKPSEVSSEIPSNASSNAQSDVPSEVPSNPHIDSPLKYLVMYPATCKVMYQVRYQV